MCSKGVFVDNRGRNSGFFEIYGNLGLIFGISFRFHPSFPQRETSAESGLLKGTDPPLFGSPFPGRAGPAAGEIRVGWPAGWSERSGRRASRSAMPRWPSDAGSEGRDQSGAVPGGDQVDQGLQRRGLHGSLEAALLRAMAWCRMRRGPGWPGNGPRPAPAIRSLSASSCTDLDFSEAVVGGQGRQGAAHQTGQFR